MKSNDVVAIPHKAGSLHAAVVRRTWLLSSHLNALGELKVETTAASLCICIYCSPHAFAFSYGSLLHTEKARRANTSATRLTLACDATALAVAIAITRDRSHSAKKKGAFPAVNNALLSRQMDKKVRCALAHCFATNNLLLQRKHFYMEHEYLSKILMRTRAKAFRQVLSRVKAFYRKYLIRYSLDSVGKYSVSYANTFDS